MKYTLKNNMLVLVIYLTTVLRVNCHGKNLSHEIVGKVTIQWNQENEEDNKIQNIQVSYSINNHLDQENSQSPEEIPNSQEQNEHYDEKLQIRIYSFNQEYANHFDQVVEYHPNDNQIEVEISQLENYAQLKVIQTKKILTILVYRYDTFEPDHKFYYFENVFNQDKPEVLIYDGFQVHEFNFEENQIQYVSQIKDDKKQCRKKMLKQKLEMPINVQFYYLDGQRGFQSKIQNEITTHYQQYMPAFLMMSNKMEFGCEFSFTQFALKISIYTFFNRKQKYAKPDLRFSSHLHIERNNNLKALLNLQVGTDKLISFCELENLEQYILEAENFQLEINQKLIFGNQVQQSVLYTQKPISLKNKKQIFDSAFFGFQGNNDFIRTISQYDKKQIQCNIFIKNFVQKNKTSIYLTYTIHQPDKELVIKQHQFFDVEENPLKNLIGQILFLNKNDNNEFNNQVLIESFDKFINGQVDETQTYPQLQKNYEQMMQIYQEDYFQDLVEDTKIQKLDYYINQLLSQILEKINFDVILSLNKDEIQVKLGEVEIKCEVTQAYKTVFKNEEKQLQLIKIELFSKLIRNQVQPNLFEIPIEGFQQEINLSELNIDNDKYQMMKLILLDLQKQKCFGDYTFENNNLQIFFYDVNLFYVANNLFLMQPNDNGNLDINFKYKKDQIKEVTCQFELNGQISKETKFEVKLYSNDEEQRELFNRFQKQTFYNSKENLYRYLTIGLKQFEIPNVLCFGDTSTYQLSNDNENNRIIIWLVEKNQYLRFTVIHFLNYNNVVFTGIYGNNNGKDFQTTENKFMSAEKYKIDSKFDTKALNFRVTSNINGINKQTTEAVDTLQTIVLPLKEYGNEYIQEVFQISLMIEFNFGGLLFYFLKPKNQNNANFFYLIGQNQSLYGLIIRSVTEHEKFHSKFEKEKWLITPNDKYHLMLNIKDGRTNQNENIGQKYPFKLDNDLSYGMFTIPDFDKELHHFDLIMNEDNVQMNNYLNKDFHVYSQIQVKNKRIIQLIQINLFFYFKLNQFIINIIVIQFCLLLLSIMILIYFIFYQINISIKFTLYKIFIILFFFFIQFMYLMIFQYNIFLFIQIFNQFFFYFI